MRKNVVSHFFCILFLLKFDQLLIMLMLILLLFSFNLKFLFILSTHPHVHPYSFDFHPSVHAFTLQFNCPSLIHSTIHPSIHPLNHPSSQPFIHPSIKLNSLIQFCSIIILVVVIFNIIKCWTLLVLKIPSSNS